MKKEMILQSLDIRAFYQSHLPSLKHQGTGQAMALCPFHNDKNPSLSVNLSTGQYKCFGCDAKGDVFDFYQKLKSVDFKTALAALGGVAPEPPRTLEAAFDYKDANGILLFQVLRHNPKSFKARRPDGKGGWVNDIAGVKLIPYNLPEVVNAECVLVVEGEKKAERLKPWGLIATCNPFGAGKWRDEFSPYLKGKRVAVLPDQDTPGKNHAEAVAKSLKGIAESIKVVDLPNLPPKGDIVNWIEQGGTREELVELIEASPEWREAIIDPCAFLLKGADLVKLECSIEWMIEGLLPKQSIILFHGRGGIGKTYLSIQIGNAISRGDAFMQLAVSKAPVYYVDFENSMAVLKDRVQKIEAFEVLFWHQTNQVKPPKLDATEWEQYKTLPPGLIIFDTLRACQGKDENNSQEMAIIMQRLKELRDAGFTILLLHHTPKANDRTYKGSTAILDLADHVLSIHRVKRTNPESQQETDAEDEEGYYRFGTQDKTRYEPFHIFLEFDPEQGFMPATDPDEATMGQLSRLIAELKAANGEPPIQSKIIEKAHETLFLGKQKIGRLLKKGEGKGWTSQKIPERKNSKVFEPLQFSSVPPLYRGGETEKLAGSHATIALSADSLQTLSGIEFSSFSGGGLETGKQENLRACLESKNRRLLDLEKYMGNTAIPQEQRTARNAELKALVLEIGKIEETLRQGSLL